MSPRVTLRAPEMVPERFRSSFSRATLQTLETHGDKFRVVDPLFFRTAYSANVTESGRRTFMAVVVAAGPRITQARCTCDPTLHTEDLCRHIGVLLARSADGNGNGSLAGERFEASLWRAVAVELFGEGRALEGGTEADQRELLLRKMVITPQEENLLKRGAASTRLQWESSAWYRWAKAMFLRLGEGEDARLELREGRFHLIAGEVNRSQVPGTRSPVPVDVQVPGTRSPVPVDVQVPGTRSPIPVDVQLPGTTSPVPVDAQDPGTTPPEPVDRQAPAPPPRLPR